MKTKLLYVLIVLGICQFTNAQTATGLHLNGDINNFDYIEVADDNLLDFTTEFTFETWVKFDQITRTTDSYDWQCLMGKSDFTQSYALMMLTERSNILRFYHPGFGSGTTSYTWSGLTINTWHHVAVSLSSTKAAIYIDGVEVASTIGTGSLTPNNNALNIGYGGSKIYPVDGAMDDIRLWNTTRTASEIMNHKDCQLNGNEAGLVLNFDLDQGTVGADNTAITTVIDKTGNGLNGTLNGFVLTGSVGNFIDAATGNGMSGICSSETLSNDVIFSSKNKVSVYPNPVTEGSFEIVNSDNTIAKSLTIYNLSGQVVQQINLEISDQPISVST